MDDVAIVVPVLNEAAAIPRMARLLAVLDPAPAEIIVVDGGSKDGSPDLARAAGLRVIECDCGRAVQINRGVAEAAAAIVCVLHADTILPDDAIAVIRKTLSDRRVALAGFTPIVGGPDKVRWATTFHNWIKTWYAPLIMRPHLFVRGVRLLFGDHAMFFRRADFERAGGCDPSLAVMEDADLCIRLGRIGSVKLVNRIVHTSDRRVVEWGEIKANYIYFKIGILWGLGARRRWECDYPDIR